MSRFHVKHTPAPWWPMEPKISLLRHQVWAEGSVGEFAVAKGISHAGDAQLIAAAPELYRALDLLVDAIDRGNAADGARAVVLARDVLAAVGGNQR